MSLLPKNRGARAIALAGIVIGFVEGYLVWRFLPHHHHHSTRWDDWGFGVVTGFSLRILTERRWPLRWRRRAAR